MKNFLILLSEKQSTLLNEDLLRTHINFLKNLRATGNLLMCGPFTDNKGAILIINAASKEEAENLISEDPFVKENYYKKFEIHEFMPAGDENNWLSDTNQTSTNLKK